jgi:DNA-binding LacI/PurR family transcriptional regulator
MESADSKPVRNAPPHVRALPQKVAAGRGHHPRRRPAQQIFPVSIVLNNAPLARRIPETTKRGIQRAASHLGYCPNLFARSLRGQRSHNVGVMVFDMTDPYCTLVLRGIDNTLYQSSFLPSLLMSTTSASDSSLSRNAAPRRPFTALMAFDDMTAFGTIRALFHAGIRVPDQYSVVGFDDVSPAAIYLLR